MGEAETAAPRMETIKIFKIESMMLEGESHSDRAIGREE